MSIREPLFNHLVEVIGRDLLYFQSTGGKQRQERADGERTCMRGITKLLKAVLIGSPLWIFAYHQVFNRYQALRAAHAPHLSNHALRIFAVMKGKTRDDDIKCFLSTGKLLGIPQ